MTAPHCARGPKLCNKCKVAEENPKICLVEVFLQPGMVTRPVGKFPIGSKEEYHEFDVVQTFPDEAEAREYARVHPDVRVLLWYILPSRELFDKVLRHEISPKSENLPISTFKNLGYYE